MKPARAITAVIAASFIGVVLSDAASAAITAEGDVEARSPAQQNELPRVYSHVNGETPPGVLTYDACDKAGFPVGLTPCSTCASSRVKSSKPACLDCCARSIDNAAPRTHSAAHVRVRCMPTGPSVARHILADACTRVQYHRDSLSNFGGLNEWIERNSKVWTQSKHVHVCTHAHSQGGGGGGLFADAGMGLGASFPEPEIVLTHDARGDGCDDPVDASEADASTLSDAPRALRVRIGAWKREAISGFLGRKLLGGDAVNDTMT